MSWIIWATSAVSLLAAAGAFCAFENNALVRSGYRVDCAPPMGLTVVQISDLHSKEFGRGNIRLLKKIKEESPDLIVCTGDIFDDSGRGREAMRSFLLRCKELAPVVFIGGNHERRLRDREALLDMLRGDGIFVLENELLFLERKGCPVYILGLDENQGSYQDYFLRAQGRYQYEGYEPLFEKLARSDGIRLVLSHYPENFAQIGEASYCRHSFDAMFSGHAHGGQFRLPFIGGLYAPGQGLFPKYTAGKHGERPALIISRGLGRSSLYLRLFNRPEIVVVKLGIFQGKNC